ncbi:ferrochelatase [Pseudoroseomonas cervicalis]|uniref:Ferrochelatase n=1 Tax=Pseudoroseomonas cervicalis ATCC 49957 TaxID=525371 RepID=D5RNK9_9PROT|nr:ferrochelatase [Pseudoroseomonas cervicalis]EFH11109.1 ferrochelatase [Pseudoroseomonas cervicalis ATCC 49957]
MSFLSATPPRPLRRAGATTGRCGVLLVNLGTPDSTRYWDVRRYLSEFLSDRRVIEINPLLWQPLLQGVILTTRPFRSGAAYRRIWNTARDESPLRSFTRAQAEKLQGEFLSDGPLIDWAMRYGRPSVAERLQALQDQGCDRILVVPLYPQYSATTTATVNDQVFRALMRMRRQPTIRIVPPFPDHPLYIKGLAHSVRRAVATLPRAPQCLVASFHGLPRRYVKAGDPYPAECNRTMRALRAELGLTAREFLMTFQSRFGREPWLEPYTDERIASLPARGITRVAVITPGFLSDCIETLDEIGTELREEFLHAGGEELTVIPCLNDTPDAIRLLHALVRENMFQPAP